MARRFAEASYIGAMRILTPKIGGWQFTAEEKIAALANAIGFASI